MYIKIPIKNYIMVSERKRSSVRGISRKSISNTLARKTCVHIYRNLNKSAERSPCSASKIQKRLHHSRRTKNTAQAKKSAPLGKLHTRLRPLNAFNIIRAPIPRNTNTHTHTCNTQSLLGNKYMITIDNKEVFVSNIITFS